MIEFPKGAVAVIFVSSRSSADDAGYAHAAEEMVSAASRFPGYLGIHSARGDDGIGITVSYWASDEAVRPVVGDGGAGFA